MADEEKILCCSFNQDHSCIAVGTTKGYKIFTCSPFRKCDGLSESKGFAIVEMLFCTSLIALVGDGSTPDSSPRRLKIFNTSTKATICDLNFQTAIVSVRMNKKRLVVVLETKIHIFDLNEVKSLETLITPANPRGVCALSPSEKKCYLAYPASPPGSVVIYDALSLTTLNHIQAHQTPVTKLCFNFEGTLLGSTSERGTVVRVFSVPQARRVQALRRGSTTAAIHSMSFNLSSSLLCVSSNTGTCHVFKIDPDAGVDASIESSHGGKEAGNSAAGPSTNDDKKSSGLLARHAKSLASSYLPEVISNMWEPLRDFAHIKLKESGPHQIAVNDRNTDVMVITTSGFFYEYNLDASKGGECSLREVRRLGDHVSDEVSARMFAADECHSPAGSTTSQLPDNLPRRSAQEHSS
eukprot:Rmarinus@m.16444